MGQGHSTADELEVGQFYTLHFTDGWEALSLMITAFTLSPVTTAPCADRGVEWKSRKVERSVHNKVQVDNDLL